MLVIHLELVLISFIMSLFGQLTGEMGSDRVIMKTILPDDGMSLSRSGC